MNNSSVVPEAGIHVIDIIESQSFERTEEVTCPLCEARRESHTIAVRFGMIAMVAECTTCRIAFQTPRPSQAASLAYMNWRWRSSDQYVGNAAAQMNRAMVQMALVKQRIDKPHPEASPSTPRLLDFGAGAGSFVRAALDQGWDVTGIEQSDSAIARAKEYYGVELQKKMGNETYDAITLWDVIEHLRDPVSLLAMLREHLTPRGHIFVETGNYESWRRLFEKDRWSLYLFDHQYYFSPYSLNRTMRQAGLDGFSLLNTHRARPTWHPASLIRHPRYFLRSWLAYSQAMTKWPAHGDIDVMVAVAQKQPAATAPAK